MNTKTGRTNLVEQIESLRAPRTSEGQPMGWSPAYLDGYRRARQDAAALARDDAIVSLSVRVYALRVCSAARVKADDLPLAIKKLEDILMGRQCRL